MRNMLTFCCALVLCAFLGQDFFVTALASAIHACMRVMNACKKKIQFDVLLPLTSKTSCVFLQHDYFTV